jgi:nitrogen-specific signal transduction histidine kinase
MSFVDITHPDDVLMDVELAERLFKREIQFYNIQKRYVKKTGEIIWINLTKSVIHGPDGEPLHGLAMVEDITEIKRTQNEAIFRQKLESVGTLAGGIAHDFNNLLGAIQAQAELALTELDPASSCRGELTTICEAAMRGSEIVRQLMIYGGKESAVIESVDLSTVVEEMLSLLKVSVTKRAVIEANLDQNLPAGARQSGATSTDCDEPYYQRLGRPWKPRWNHSRDHKASAPGGAIDCDFLGSASGRLLRATGGLRYR